MRTTAYLMFAACASLAVINSFASAEAQTGRSRIADACATIATKICSLDSAYPVPPAKTYSPPTCLAANPPTAAERMFVVSAILQAKGQLKKDLCSLTNIFISKGDSPPPSYGFWEDPANHPTGPSNNAYVILHPDDLNRTFSARQDQNRQGLNITVGNHTESGLPGSVVPEIYGLLYVLAHEMGHIKWHQQLSSQPCKNQLNASWTSLSSNQPQFTGFGADFGMRDYTSIPKPAGANTQNWVDKIYKGGFATALASANPEEDFVESYAVRAVANACGNSCIFQYNIAGDGSDTVNLTDSRGNSALGGKFACADGSTGLRSRWRKRQ